MRRMRVVLAALSALMLAVVLTLASAPTVPASANATIDSQTNQYRIANGLPALQTWGPLQEVAKLRAVETSKNWSHPSDWQYLFNMLPSCVRGLGENIAYYRPVEPPATWPVDSWIASDSHRHNILGNWDWQASATVKVGDTTYAVQLFAKGCATTSQPPAPSKPTAPKPAPSPAPAPQQPRVTSLPNTATW